MYPGRWRERLFLCFVIAMAPLSGARIFAPSKVNAAGPSAERGKERLMIGWVALNLFFFWPDPSFVRGLGRSMRLVE